MHSQRRTVLSLNMALNTPMRAKQAIPTHTVGYFFGSLRQSVPRQSLTVDELFLFFLVVLAEQLGGSCSTACLTLISVSASSAAKLQPSRGVASYLRLYAACSTRRRRARGCHTPSPIHSIYSSLYSLRMDLSRPASILFPSVPFHASSPWGRRRSERLIRGIQIVYTCGAATGILTAVHRTAN